MHVLGLTPMLAENSLFHAIGQIFHPVFVLFANVLAFIYGIVPNYAISIVILTILVMAVLTPLTVKSTKSMIAMQELQPEIKKLQQKYKGAENREQLNQEMMRLYKEKGINPAGGCLPMLLQMPFLIVLYDMIQGLTNMTGNPPHPAPEYVSHSSSLYHDLVHSGGQMVSFGMNLAARPFSHHPSIWAAIPFFVMVAVAVALSYFQMAQMTRRNPQAAQTNKQMQMMQKFMPLLMAYIYFLVPAAVVIYMIVSTLIRIGTQDIMFRMGIVQPAGGGERALPGGSPGAKGGAGGEVPAGTAALAAGTKSKLGGMLRRGRPEEVQAPPSSGQKTNGAKPAPSGAKKAKANGSAPRPAGAAKNGSAKRPPPGNRRQRSRTTGQQGAAPSPKSHPRSKSKRARKAR